MSDVDEAMPEEVEGEDLLEEEEEEESIVIMVSRGIGGLVRSVSDRLEDLQEAIASKRSSSREVSTPKSVGVELERLGEIVSAHKAGGYASLEHDEDFWRVVTRLRRTVRRKRVKRGRSLVSKRVKGEPRAEQAPAQPEQASAVADPKDTATRKKTAASVEKTDSIAGGESKSPAAASQKSKQSGTDKKTE